MADSAVSSWSALTGSSMDASNDLIPIIDVSATGSAKNKNITPSELISVNAWTFSAAQTISVAGAASASALKLTGALYTGGTGTTTFPLIFHQPTGATAATTWSSGANNGTVYGANETTGFTGNFLDMRIAGTSKFSVDSNGAVSFISGFAALNSAGTFTSATTAAFGSTGVYLANNVAVQWSSTTAWSGSIDTTLIRDGGAGILAQKSGSQAQTHRIYGDATKYAELKHDGTDGYLGVSSGTLRIKGLPTSSAGLASGTLWNNSGTIAVA